MTAYRGIVSRVVAFELTLGIVALALALLFRIDLTARLDVTAARVGIGVAAALPMIVALFGLDAVAAPGIRGLVDRVADLAGPWFASSHVLTLGVVAVAAGVGEELLFRGLLQTGMEARLGPLLAVAVTSVVFGLLHALTPLYALLATLVSVYLGWLVLVSDALVVPIVAHAAYDWVALVFLVRRYRAVSAQRAQDPSRTEG